MSQNSNSDMSFLQHLEVLRWHLMRSVVAIILGGVFAFVNKPLIFDTIIFGPKREDFITYKALCALSLKFNEWMSFVSPDILCIGKNLPELQNLMMAGQFMSHIKISMIAGLIIAFPYIVWEVWRFIKPGLKATEAKATRWSVFYISVLFTSGILFGYLIISPLSINFFSNYQISPDVNNQFTLNTYITTVTTIVLACGFLFELPVFIYFLAKAGIVTPDILRAYRKHSFVGALVLSAVITPPDVFSQVLVTLPLAVLYELSIIIAKKVQANEAKLNA